MKKVCFASGNFYLLGKKNVEEEIKQSLRHNVDGIEITFEKPKDVYGFKLRKRTLNKLKKLKFNTIHAPYFTNKYKRLYYWNSPKYKRLLKRMQSIYDKVNAININFHPQLIKNFKLLQDDEYEYSIENATERWELKPSYYKKILNKYPHINFLLDTSHAIATKQLKDFIKKFKEKIKFVHLSNVYDGNHHMFLFDSTKKELKQLKNVRNLDCPFIIEVWYNNKDVFKFFKKEINFVKKWLKK